MDQSSNGHFGMVPSEIMIQIFNYLAHRDRKKSRLVSYRWNQILDDWGKYFVFHAKWSKRTLNSIFNTNLCVDRVTLQNMTSRMPPSPFPEIKESVLGWRNSEENILKFLFECQNVVALTIVKFSLGEISETAIRKSLHAIVWNNLTQLKMTMILTKYKFERTRIHLENCTTLLQLIKIPNVRELDFYFEVKHSGPRSNEKPEVRFQNVCLAMYKFLSSHSNSMKYLTCLIGTTRRRKFVLPEIPEIMKQSMTEKLELESCTLKLWGVGQIEVLVSPVWLGSRIKYLDLETTKCVHKRGRMPRLWTADTHLPTFENNLSQIFTTNGCTLQNVRLYNLPTINFSWLKNCTRLETLALVRFNNFTPMPQRIPCPISNSSLKTLISFEISDFFLEVDLAWFENCPRLENLHIEASILLPQQILLQSGHQMNLKQLFLSTDANFIFDPRGRLLTQQFLDRNGQTLQWLTLGFTPYVSLNNLFALRFLKIPSFLHDYTHNCSSLNFTYLTELYVTLICCHDNYTIDWILLNMQNLKTISMLCGACVPVLQKLLSLPKSKKIEFVSLRNDDEVVEFCQRTPGLQLKREFDIFCSLLVDRSVYNTQ